MQAKQAEELPFFIGQWKSGVWHEQILYTDQKPIDLDFNYLTKHHKMLKRKLSFPVPEFQHQMANKRKEKYFWNIICSIFGWYKIKVTDY